MNAEQMPDELRSVQQVAQHAMGILSNMLQGGITGSDVVDEAWRLADAFDVVFKKRVAAAVAASPALKAQV